MKRGAGLLLTCLAFVACRSNRTTPAPPDAADAGTLASVHVDNGSPADLTQALERATGRHIDVDDDALVLMVCAHVTLHRDGLDASALGDAVAQALRPLGLALAPTPSGWAVHRLADAPAAPCPTPPVGPPAPGADPRLVAEVRRGITRKSATHLEVSARARELIADPNLRQVRVRIVPEEADDGGHPGVRLFGVVPTDVLGALGIENGDRVESISDRTIDSERAARDAFASLRSATTCTVRLTRKGKPLELRYDAAR